MEEELDCGGLMYFNVYQSSGFLQGSVIKLYIKTTYLLHPPGLFVIFC